MKFFDICMYPWLPVFNYGRGFQFPLVFHVKFQQEKYLSGFALKRSGKEV